MGNENNDAQSSVSYTLPYIIQREVRSECIELHDFAHPYLQFGKKCRFSY